MSFLGFDPAVPVAADPRLRPRGYWDRPFVVAINKIIARTFLRCFFDRRRSRAQYSDYEI